MNRLDDFNWNRQPKRSKGWDIWFGFCALLGLALTGFGVWAVYTLVVWVTSK